MCAFGAFLTLLCCAGLCSSTKDEPLLAAWLPPNTWRQSDKDSTEGTWGAQRLDQVIITPAPGQTWSRYATGNLGRDQTKLVKEEEDTATKLPSFL